MQAAITWLKTATDDIRNARLRSLVSQARQLTETITGPLGASVGPSRLHDGPLRSSFAPTAPLVAQAELSLRRRHLCSYPRDSPTIYPSSIASLMRHFLSSSRCILSFSE